MSETNESLLEDKKKKKYDTREFLTIKKGLDEFETNQLHATSAYTDSFSPHPNQMVVTKHTRVFTICDNHGQDITREGDIAFAICHRHSTDLRIDLSIGKRCYTQILSPNQIEWIFDGLPILIIKLSFVSAELEFFDVHTGHQIDNVTTDVYYGRLQDKVRDGLACKPIQSKLKHHGYHIYDRGLFYGPTNRVCTECFFHRDSLVLQKQTRKLLKEKLHRCLMDLYSFIQVWQLRPDMFPPYAASTQTILAMLDVKSTAHQRRRIEAHRRWFRS